MRVGYAMIRCVEVVEANPMCTGIFVGELANIHKDDIRSYLTRASKMGLIEKYPPSPSIGKVPKFRAIAGWRDTFEPRADRVMKKGIKPIVEKIKHLPAGVKLHQRPRTLINSVWSLGML